MSTIKLVLIIILGLFSFSIQEKYSVALITDLHIGERPINVDYLKASVKYINEAITSRNIKFVFVLGDVTHTADEQSYLIASRLLNEIKVPFFPILGNHDMWPHNSTYRTDKANGDFLFAKYFQNCFAPRSGFVYNSKPTYNPQHNITSWFQNWEFQYGDVVFYGLDWNMRTRWKFPFKGVVPGADLHDFPGGTFQWFKERLSILKKKEKQPKTIVMLQHQPFIAPFYVPDFIWGFSGEKFKAIEKLLTSFYGKDDPTLWGIFSGHYHRWYSGTVFKNWNFQQWETNANRNKPSITLVSFENSKVAKVEKMVQ